jgi:hypothetical protein
MTAFRAVIIPTGAAGDGGGSDGSIDNELPGGGFGGFGGLPDNSLPGGRPGHPSFGPVVPPHGPWPGFPVRPWVPSFPTPPIVIPPGPVIGNDLPIQLPPGAPGNALPVQPVRPAHPIVLPPMPEGYAALALVIPVPPRPPTGPDNTLPGGPPVVPGGGPVEPEPTPQGVPAGATKAVIYFGPGTVPVVAYIAPAATPK